MNLSPEDRAIGEENFYAAIASPALRREFLQTSIRAGVKSKAGLGSYYFGYEKTVKEPLRVGVIGTGDEGSVLIGALNPAFVQVKAIADIRPFSVYRAFHGEVDQPARPGLMKIYDWKTEDDAKKNVKVYGGYEDLIKAAKDDGLEAVIIALPLHLHAPAAIAAMKAGLHVLTEKLMAKTIAECKEMIKVAHEAKLYLAVGHQRHYNILYNNAVELIKRGGLGDIHYIRAQWHRRNQPGSDSWKQPLPPGVKTVAEDPKADQLAKELIRLTRDLEAAKKPDKNGKVDVKKVEQIERQMAQKAAQVADKEVDAKKFGYEDGQLTDANGKLLYRRPALEELIRWRLWDRTGAGMMAELGSHQLDAASIVIAAMHQLHGAPKDKLPLPLSVAASCNRPVFPADRDIEDHVCCIFEFPHPEYDPKDPEKAKKKIGVQYASINGNGFGGYGEAVFGTQGTLLLETEKDALLYKLADSSAHIRMVADKDKKPLLTESPTTDEESSAIGKLAMLEATRGYPEEIEHWAWCVRNPAPENQPRCNGKVAMKDAVIALTANKAARESRRIEFKPEWFDAESPETPDKA